MGGAESTISQHDTTNIEPKLLEVVVDVWKKKYAKKKHLDKKTLQKLLNDPQIQEVCHNPALISPGAVDHVFVFLDTDNSGTVSPQELVLGLSALTNGTTIEKADILFTSMDVNNDGNLSKEELTKSLTKAISIAAKIVNKEVTSIAKHSGLPGVAAMIPGKMAADQAKSKMNDGVAALIDEIFNACDVNKDGVISKEEWLAQCETHQGIKTLLNVVTRDRDTFKLEGGDKGPSSKKAANIAAECPVAGTKI